MQTAGVVIVLEIGRANPKDRIVLHSTINASTTMSASWRA
jgi:hypothetical protein